MSSYFSWRSTTGPLQSADRLPDPAEPVIELIFNRCPNRLKQDGVRPHEGHPAHEAAMRAELPASLQILRVDGCRLRTWPQRLPRNLLEFYAAGCDFFSVPDLSAWPHLIVLEMPDNRAETLNRPLPPTLARLSLETNALNEVTTTQPDTLASVSFRSNPGLSAIVERDRLAYKRMCDAALDAAAERARLEGRIFTPHTFTDYPPRPPSSLPAWVLYSMLTVHQYENTMRPGRLQNAGMVVRPRLPDITPAISAPNPYTNRESVHDSGIQDSTRHNLRYIATYKPDVPHDPQIIDTIATALHRNASLIGNLTRQFALFFTAGLLEDPVCAALRAQTDTPYSMHGYTIRDIVDRLWLRITDFPEPTRQEVIQRFTEEVLEARGFCANGFMVRMSNVLVGFDENCTMRLRPSQILQARIPATMKRLREAVTPVMLEGHEPWTFWRDCLTQTWSDMEDVEMPHDERAEWLTPLISPMLEDLCRSAEALKAEGKVLDEQIAAAMMPSAPSEDPVDKYSELLAFVSTAPVSPSLYELRVAKAAIPARIADAIAESIASAKLDLATKNEGGRGLAFYVETAMIETLGVTVPSRMFAAAALA